MKNALIIILYDHPWEHTADYATQACKYISNDNIVIGVLMKDALSLKEFIGGKKWPGFFRKRSSGFYTYTPFFVVPFRRFSYIYEFNSILNALFLKCVVTIISVFQSSQKNIVWVFNPEQYKEALLLKGNGLLLYDCVDFHAVTGITFPEKKLLKRSSYVFVNSTVLYRFYQSFRSDIHLVPLGFDNSTFQKNIPSTLKKNNKPIIGYIGGINSRLDFSLLQTLASANPQWDFYFIGPLQMHAAKDVFENRILPKIQLLFALKNVRHIDFVPKEFIGEYIRQFSVCMIPYTTTLVFNMYCFPMKVLEYFYFGKPVIATPIKELYTYARYIRIGSTSLSWQQHIRKLIRSGWSKSIQKAQRRIAITNSWEHKFEKMLSVIDTKTV